jgi:hypothetical protein
MSACMMLLLLVSRLIKPVNQTDLLQYRQSWDIDYATLVPTRYIRIAMDICVIWIFATSHKVEIHFDREGTWDQTTGWMVSLTIQPVDQTITIESHFYVHILVVLVYTYSWSTIYYIPVYADRPMHTRSIYMAVARLVLNITLIIIYCRL